MNRTFDTDESYALRLDADDSLALFRERFCLRPGAIYMLANSLGLMPVAAEKAARRVLDEWRTLGIGGWLEGNPPWFYLAERTGEAAAALVGASPEEVICTGTTTFNIHSLIGTLYRPALGRTKIVACSLDFPTDIYALKSQMMLHGLDWREHLVLVGGDCGGDGVDDGAGGDDVGGDTEGDGDGGGSGLVDEGAIIEAMTDDVSIVHLSSVLYRSGQLLDIERLTAAAHARGIMIGFDCSHSVGILPHRLDAWDVDFAMWCGYKYLCGGPGSPAFLCLNRRFFDCEPGLAGWFGYVKERQFDLSLDFEHARNAGGWQVSSPGILGAAALAGALEVVCEAGIERIREKSLHMTSYLMYLADELLSGAPCHFGLMTPREPSRRGGHVALTHPVEALRIKEALALRGVVVDFRPPDVIRIAPSPLYSSYHDIWAAVRHIREIVDTKEYERIPQRRREIS